MAWQTPKTDWTGADGVRDVDFNRIEGNILELYESATANSDMVVYVATTGSDDTGDGTAASPYRTINKAVESIPGSFGINSVKINISAGTYDEDVVLRGFSGVLSLYSAGIVNIRSMLVEGCSVYQYGSQTNYKRGLIIDYGGSYIGQSIMYISEAGYSGLVVRNGSRFVLYNTATVSNTTSVAIEVTGSSMLYISIIAGTSNTTGLRVDTGSVASYGSMNMTATTLRVTNTGGRIYTGSQLS